MLAADNRPPKIIVRVAFIVAGLCMVAAGLYVVWAAVTGSRITVPIVGPLILVVVLVMVAGSRFTKR